MRRYEGNNHVAKIFPSELFNTRVALWEYHPQDGWTQKPDRFFIAEWVAEEFVLKLTTK
jgi:hypothetical protein